MTTQQLTKKIYNDDEFHVAHIPFYFINDKDVVIAMLDRTIKNFNYDITTYHNLIWLSDVSSDVWEQMKGAE